MEENTILQCPSPSAFIIDDDLLEKINLHMKPRKRVSFYDDDNLVRIREIPPRGDSPLSEELEECHPESLSEDFEGVSLGSIIGSYDVGKTNPRNGDIVSQITGIGSPFAKGARTTTYRSYKAKRSYGTPGTVIKVNPTPVKANTSRRVRHKKDPEKQKHIQNRKSPSQITYKQRERLNSAIRATAKERVPSATKIRTKSPNPDLTCRPSTPKFSIKPDPCDFRSSIPSTAAFQETTNSLISELPWLTLPRIHHSPYRQAATPPPPEKAKTSPSALTLQREGTQTSISSLEFKTISPRYDQRKNSRDNGAVRSNHRMYAWQVANGMTSVTPVMTPCISQMWDISKSPVDSIQPS